MVVAAEAFAFPPGRAGRAGVWDRAWAPDAILLPRWGQPAENGACPEASRAVDGDWAKGQSPLDLTGHESRFPRTLLFRYLFLAPTGLLTLCLTVMCFSYPNSHSEEVVIAPYDRGGNWGSEWWSDVAKAHRWAEFLLLRAQLLYWESQRQCLNKVPVFFLCPPARMHVLLEMSQQKGWMP